MAPPQIFGVPLKYVSLLVLTVQNSLLVLTMRYSRISSTASYYTSTAVLLSELTKFLVCFAIAFSETRHSPYMLIRDILTGDGWKMLVPAALYTVQNNLQYVAVSHLDAATFQVTYQLKILTTALCSVILLRTRLGGRKWVALVVLTVGVALVQLPADNNGNTPTGTSALGLAAVILACVLSGLAGVYFEKVLKGTSKSVWIRNVQLALFSMAPAAVGVLWVDGPGVRRDGFLYGYDKWTWLAISFQALGGLVVAVVVKYADNILKGFATSVSIVLSCLASVVLFDFHVSFMFVVGAMLVIYATYLYGAADRVQGRAKTTPLPVAAMAVERRGEEDEIPLRALSK
ncbi:UDP-galactose transporter Gms1 [Coemansia sp. RSA 1722]|nr:UDP-galactose transporter Gms1 [Coemansia sp. RSA 485]KAJ2596802.1 UDP-galactose transporter Gms1 [Coemansia sp. RSA 1722]KAJ2636857.1 UDP-galactose transporter Gms1 [Coemansia sp. RSA 1286]